MPIWYAKGVNQRAGHSAPVNSIQTPIVQSPPKWLVAALGYVGGEGKDQEGPTIDTSQGSLDSALNSRLPIEILGEIFKMCIKEDTAFESTISSSLYKHPQSLHVDPDVLAQVCQHWRETALSTASLWSMIHISQHTNWPIGKVKLWLERSKGHELSLQLLDLKLPQLSTNKDVVKEILSLFIGEIHRWRDIYFIIHPPAHPSLGSIQSGAATALQSAHVHSIDPNFPIAVSFWQALYSPSLRRIKWASYLELYPVRVPWAQLSHVTLQCNLPMDVVLSILAESQHSIVEFEAQNIFSSHDTPPTPQEIMALPNLRALHIGSKTRLMPLLERLTLPALTSLWLTLFNQATFSREHISFQAFLQRSGCRLERLHIMDWFMPEEDLIGYLAAPQMTRLKELQLRVMTTDISISMLVLRPPGKEPQLLPELEAIHFGGCWCFTSDGSISKMIISRLATLKTALVFLRSMDSTRDIAAFEEVVQDYPWLDVVVTNTPFSRID